MCLQNQDLIGMDFVIVSLLKLHVSGVWDRMRGYMDIDVDVIVVAGSYTVVASTFEPDLIGQFILTVASSTKIHTEAIPAEGAVSFIYRHDPMLSI